MYWRFLRAAFLPHLVLGAVTAITTNAAGEAALWMIPIGIPAAALWTFVNVTGGRGYHPPVASETQVHAPVRNETPMESPSRGLVVFGIACGVITVSQAAAAVSDGLQRISEAARDREWDTITLLVMIPDFLVTLLVLWRANGFQSFVRTEAVKEVRRFYRRHEDALTEEIPEPILTAELREIASDASPAQAWHAAHALLGRLEDVTRRWRERMKKTQARQKKLGEEEAALAARLKKLDASDPSREFVEQELEDVRARKRKAGDDAKVMTPDDL